MPEMNNFADLPLTNLRALASELPYSRTAQVRLAWENIRATLRAGHSRKLIHQQLCHDGVSISYSALARYINRLQFEDTKRSGARTGPSERLRTTGNVGERADPLAGALAALSKPRYVIRQAMCDGDPTKKKLF